MTKTKSFKSNYIFNFAYVAYFTLTAYVTYVLLSNFTNLGIADTSHIKLSITWALILSISIIILAFKRKQVNKYFVIPLMLSIFFSFAFLSLDHFNNISFKIFGIYLKSLVINFSWIAFIILGLYLIKISVGDIKFKQIFHLLLTAIFAAVGAYAVFGLYKYTAPYEFMRIFLDDNLSQGKFAYPMMAWESMLFFAVFIAIFLRKKINKIIAIVCPIAMFLGYSMFIGIISIERDFLFVINILTFTSSYIVFTMHSAKLLYKQLKA